MRHAYAAQRGVEHRVDYAVLVRAEEFAFADAAGREDNALGRRVGARRAPGADFVEPACHRRIRGDVRVEFGQFLAHAAAHQACFGVELAENGLVVGRHDLVETLVAPAAPGVQGRYAVGRGRLYRHVAHKGFERRRIVHQPRVGRRLQSVREGERAHREGRVGQRHQPHERGHGVRRRHGGDACVPFRWHGSLRRTGGVSRGAPGRG